MDEASTQAVANQSLQQDHKLYPQESCTCLIDKVSALLRIEQLVTHLLLPKQSKQGIDDGRQEVSRQGQSLNDKSGKLSSPEEPKSTEDHSSTCKISELAHKLQEADAATQTVAIDLTESCKQVFHLLLHLPFVQVSDCKVDSEVSLINPRSISSSTAKDGAAQCFLVIQESAAVDPKEFENSD